MIRTFFTLALLSAAIVMTRGADYFVAVDGHDLASGTREQPWGTVAHALTKVGPGDSILVRGGIYRQQVLIDGNTGGISGAPGKPITIRSAPGEEASFFLSRPMSQPEDWRQVGPQLWATAPGSLNGYDVGCVWHDDHPSEKKWARSELQAPWDFWFDAENKCVTVCAPANPATLALSIEIPVGQWMQHTVQLRKVSHVVLADLTIKYSNTHGIQMTEVHDVMVRNCRISHVGGAWIWADHTRFGNGVELWCDGTDITVEGCQIAWCFDTGITNQGDKGDQARVYFRNNQIAHTKCGLEHWATGPANVRDVLYEGNTITDSGDNWAHNLQNVWGAIRLMRHHPNNVGADKPNTGSVERFEVRGNTIERCGSRDGAQQGPPLPFAEHPSIRLIGGEFEVTDNLIREGKSVGIFASHGFAGTIRNNTITRGAGPGLQLENISPRAVIEHNRIDPQ
jgi:hypothetical protein